MSPRALLAEVRRRDALLWAVGWVNLGLLALMLPASLLDVRQVLGLDPWIKPMKFASSIAIYAWTVAWLLGEVRGARAARATVSVTVAVSMMVEIACIALQSARGVRSHFNADSAFDGQVFGVMGAMIAANTVAAALLLVLLLVRAAPAPREYLWGARLGLAVFLGGSAVGGMMVGQGAHAVGVPDGGPGLPFVNWSTEGGDLRAAHMVGLHALQVLPLAGLALARTRWSTGARLAALLAFTAVYTATGVALLHQARAGRPMLAFERDLGARPGPGG
jgi:hypothetical protein